MGIRKAFGSLNKIIRVLLLLFPIINWIVEIVLRLDLFISKKNLKSLVLFILSLFFGVIMGWIDCVMNLLGNSLFSE